MQCNFCHPSMSWTREKGSNNNLPGLAQNTSAAGSTNQCKMETLSKELLRDLK